MHYADAEVDALLTAARVELDGAARRVLYHRFNRLIHRDQPVTLMVHPINSLLLHKRFQAARPEWIGIFPEKWWVAPADRLHKRGTGR
jgi:ABC-type transport system substrate-binding protein